MGMILRIASSRIVGQGDIVGRSGYFSLNLSANSVMRGRLDARRTLKSLVADLRLISYKTCFIKIMFANLSNQMMYCTSLNKYSRSLPFSSSRTKRPSCSTRSRRAENLPPASS